MVLAGPSMATPGLQNCLVWPWGGPEAPLDGIWKQPSSGVFLSFSLFEKQPSLNTLARPQPALCAHTLARDQRPLHASPPRGEKMQPFQL